MLNGRSHPSLFGETKDKGEKEVGEDENEKVFDLSRSDYYYEDEDGERDVYALHEAAFRPSSSQGVGEGEGGTSERRGRLGGRRRRRRHRLPRGGTGSRDVEVECA